MRDKKNELKRKIIAFFFFFSFIFRIASHVFRLAKYATGSPSTLEHHFKSQS